LPAKSTTATVKYPSTLKNRNFSNQPDEAAIFRPAASYDYDQLGRGGRTATSLLDVKIILEL
jgi:hypothetical protein